MVDVWEGEKRKGSERMHGKRSRRVRKRLIEGVRRKNTWKERKEGHREGGAEQTEKENSMLVLDRLDCM